ncbi:MAG: HGGxSTG domain-containing protein [Pseudomonadota bacterium]
MAIMRFTGLPWLTFGHDGKWYEVKPSGISKRICGARKKDGSPCRSKSLHRGGKCKFHGGLSTGAKTPEGRARAIAAMRAGWVRWKHDQPP